MFNQIEYSRLIECNRRHSLFSYNSKLYILHVAMKITSGKDEWSLQERELFINSL